MEKNTGYNPDVAKYREGILKLESDYPSHSWERTFLAGSAMIDIPHSLTEDPKWRRNAWKKHKKERSQRLIPQNVQRRG